MDFLIDRIKSYSKLEDGWAGRNSIKITSDAIESVKYYILNKMPIDLPSPSPAPCGDGSVYLDWSFRPYIHIDIIFEADGSMSYYCDSESLGNLEIDNKGSIVEANGVYEKFVGDTVIDRFAFINPFFEEFKNLTRGK